MMIPLEDKENKLNELWFQFMSDKRVYGHRFFQAKLIENGKVQIAGNREIHRYVIFWTAVRKSVEDNNVNVVKLRSILESIIEGEDMSTVRVSAGSTPKRIGYNITTISQLNKR